MILILARVFKQYLLGPLTGAIFKDLYNYLIKYILRRLKIAKDSKPKSITEAGYNLRAVNSPLNDTSKKEKIAIDINNLSAKNLIIGKVTSPKVGVSIKNSQVSGNLHIEQVTII